ncbi:MAG: GIY-YIG nuclease family protein [Gemmatimonadota bacterium]|nr:GIY-YIG nuclease family protein [Gemmatimonadota bacterium]
MSEADASGGATLPDDRPGTYVLLFALGEDRRASAGALGPIDLEAGFYTYVGSALGPGGVRARIGRHVRGSGRPHWHVDSLRAVAAVSEVWFRHDPGRRECGWTAALREIPGFAEEVPGFGASDCGCRSHLLRFARRPGPNELSLRLGEGGEEGTGPLRVAAVRRVELAAQPPASSGGASSPSTRTRK